MCNNYLFISGILTKPKMVDGWREDLNRNGLKGRVIGDVSYTPFSDKQISDILNEGNKLIKEETIVIGHSFGGLIGRILANQNPNIIALGLMATPNNFIGSSLAGRFGFLGNYREIDIKTFGGSRDTIVLDQFARSYDSVHTTLDAYHECFLNEISVRRKVLYKLRQ